MPACVGIGLEFEDVELQPDGVIRMHCDIPLTFVKIVIILWKIWRRKHPHWNSEVDFAFYMYQERNSDSNMKCFGTKH